MEEILNAKNIIKTYNEGKTVVLNDVSLVLNKGDFLSIVGASGSGKSTLLTIIGGIDRPDSGQVLLNGVDIAKMKERELAVLRRTKIGFVFQFFNLAPNLTVLENIMLPIVLSNKKPKDFKQKAEKLMDYLNISPHRDKLPAKLSGGEQQRAAIARGMVFNPEVLLLDEPTGNLDSNSGNYIMQLLKNINREFKTTIVQVTHSTANSEYGNKIITIQDGKIIAGNTLKTFNQDDQKNHCQDNQKDMGGR